MCSRARPSILETNVTNILSLADNPEEVEILIGADLDDLSTHKTVVDLQDQFGGVDSNITLVIRERFKNLHQFYNLLASKACGSYVWGMNDDSICEIPSWDTDFANQIEKQIASYKDRIGYFAISSNSADSLGDYGEFPIVTQEALTTVGFMDYEGVAAWGCDRIMQRIYQSVGREFYIKVDRPLRHLLHEGGTIQNDNRIEMEKSFKEQFGQDWNQAVGNMKEFIETVDLTPYTQRLWEKIGAVACES